MTIRAYPSSDQPICLCKSGARMLRTWRSTRLITAARHITPQRYQRKWRILNVRGWKVPRRSGFITTPALRVLAGESFFQLLHGRGNYQFVYRVVKGAHLRVGGGHLRDAQHELAIEGQVQ